MSNFGKKYDPNKRIANKLKKERTIDLSRMMRDSNKKQKSSTKKSTYKKSKIRSGSIGWGLIIFLIILLLSK